MFFLWCSGGMQHLTMVVRCWIFSTSCRFKSLTHVRSVVYGLIGMTLHFSTHTHPNFSLSSSSRKYWVGHSKWLLQLLKSLDWSDAEISRNAAAYIQDLPRGSRQTDCSAIWCSSRCEIHIDAGGMLTLSLANCPHLSSWCLIDTQ